MIAMTPPYSETVGAALLASRKERGWSQARLAAESGVPQTVISSIERATHANPPLETVKRLCTALDAELVVEVRPTRVVGKSDQRDPAHAACVAGTRRILERAGWTTASEVEIVTGRARGFIDLIAFDAATRRLLVIEVKTEIRDVGGLERQVGWYLREAWATARRLDWKPRSVSGVVVCLATAAVDAVALANREELAAAFPIRGRAVRAVLNGGATIDKRGLVLLDPLRRGTAGLLTLAADGRRTPPPYRDYAAFLRARAARARRTSSAVTPTGHGGPAPGRGLGGGRRAAEDRGSGSVTAGRTGSPSSRPAGSGAV